MTADQLPDLLTDEHLAAYLGVSVRLVQQRRAQGCLDRFLVPLGDPIYGRKTFRHGKCPRYSKDKIVRAVKEGSFALTTRTRRRQLKIA